MPASAENTSSTVRDQKTADAFSTSWNNLPAGSVYTFDQFKEWMDPLGEKDFRGKQVLELGCGNASHLVHLKRWSPAEIVGVDLGDSVKSARENLANAEVTNATIVQADLTGYESKGFDLVFSIGVLHHLTNPKNGFDAVLRNVKPGGKFHCWVYAREGNSVIVWFVDPLRKLTCRLPWWFTKYLIATPLVIPYYFYAKVLSLLPRVAILRRLPLYDYSIWISRCGFLFFRHVAFDQLVTPQTVYLKRETIESWLKNDRRIEQGSTYLIFRNGNSWKFGGRLK